MTKQKILLLIPLTIIASLIFYCWTIILFTEVEATWRHYIALGLFSGIVYLFFKNFRWTVLSTGLYLILGTLNLLSLTASIVTNSYGIRISSIEIWTPTFQLLSFGLLILFIVLNIDNLIDIYLDFKEKK